MMVKRRGHKLDGKIAVSKAAMRFHSKYVPGEYEIIPNGIDIEHFSPGVSPIEEFCDGKKNILFVGRLEHRKGLHYLLKAYRQIKKEVPDSRLIVVGPGTRLRKRYEGWIKRRRIPWHNAGIHSPRRPLNTNTSPPGFRSQPVSTF